MTEAEVLVSIEVEVVSILVVEDAAVDLTTILGHNVETPSSSKNKAIKVPGSARLP